MPENASVDFVADAARLGSVWDARALQYGARCALNLSHPPEAFDRVTTRQKRLLLPLLARVLGGRRRRLLDYGCGPGRFSVELAAFLNDADSCSVTAFDVSEEVLKLAPSHQRVGYTTDVSIFEHDRPESSFDVIWVCLVLGGLSDEMCREVGGRLRASLEDGGLLFFVEHISSGDAGSAFWRFRPLAFYENAFGRMKMRTIGRYWDLGSEVSVVVGIKPPGRSLLRWPRYIASLLRAVLTENAFKSGRPPQALDLA
jgi:SAM-dependent methyltransferase